jgi:hypothetical protein
MFRPLGSISLMACHGSGKSLGLSPWVGSKMRVLNMSATPPTELQTYFKVPCATISMIFSLLLCFGRGRIRAAEGLGFCVLLRSSLEP